MIDGLLRTREALWIALAAAVAVAVGFLRRDAAGDRDRAAGIEEMHRAKDIRDRVDRARRRRADGLRPFADAGWRD